MNCTADPRSVVTVCMYYPGPSIAEQAAYWALAGVGVVLIVALLIVLMTSRPGGRQ